MDAVQYGMLLAMFMGGRGQDIPTVELLQLLSDSSLRQQEVDLTHGEHWSRHLLVNIQKATAPSF